MDTFAYSGNEARAEAIEREKQAIDEQIEILRDIRDNSVLSLDQWAEFDRAIDNLLIEKDNITDNTHVIAVQQARLGAESNRHPEWDDLGTRCIISGGEVMELTARPAHGSPAWFDSIEEIPF